VPEEFVGAVDEVNVLDGRAARDHEIILTAQWPDSFPALRR
jgi:hypothetical protein